MKRFQNNNNGFTLIEALVAMVILAISLLALTTMQVTAIKGNATSSSISTASTWGTDYLEEIFTLEYDDLLDTDNDGIAGLSDIDSQADASPRSSVVTPDGNYSVFINVAEGTSVSPMPNTKKVRVVIVNNNRPNAAHVTMDYIKHKYM